MAMEKHLVMRDTHTRAITALGYNPNRREFMIGCEDGVIKTFEADTGKLVNTYNDHQGWVTDFLFWVAEPKVVKQGTWRKRLDTKLILSSSNDGTILAWGSGGSMADKVNIGVPVYCMAVNPRRHQLLCGVQGGIRVYDLDDEKESGHYIINKLVYMAREHTDIVRCIICYESRVYSAGYDQKLIIYDSSYTGDKSMVASKTIKAHDAGISTMLLIKDNENATWIITGSFDKTVRIWNSDGQILHKLDGFLNTVTGICYVPRNKTIWAAGGTSYAYLYDPKSGDNVSDFIGTFQSEEEEKYHLGLLKYFPELNVVLATTSRRNLILWKYNSSGCVTALKCRTAIEAITYTKKVPLLLFSGDFDGLITKWERMQSNHFMYSKEFFPLTEARKAHKRVKKEYSQSERETDNDEFHRNKKNKEVSSHYGFNKPQCPPVSIHNHPHTTILRIVFIEELDLIVAGCEDNNIYVWGFDEDAVNALKTMAPPDTDVQLVRKYAILLGRQSALIANKQMMEEDSVTNRVAGFKSKFILAEHTSCVTSLAIVNKASGIYVLSAGWDRRICIWHLQEGRLQDVFRNSSITGSGAHDSFENVQLACDGIITDMCYCATRDEFAYSSSDRMVYIRKFSIHGHDMPLLNTLQGHTCEVTCVRWSKFQEKWITGSEDGTIRVWHGSGMNEEEQVLSSSGGTVATLTIDSVNGAIVAAVHDIIRVYEPGQYRLVQSNVGHQDAIRSIIHIPERKQYVSCGWDKTIRIWNSWSAPRTRRKTSKDHREEDLRSAATSGVPLAHGNHPGDDPSNVAEEEEEEMEVEVVEGEEEEVVVETSTGEGSSP